MQHTTIRFVHASDLHLERPVGGLSEPPDHLQQLLVDAPYLAAERVFDCAVAEAVDFLLLAGDVVDVHWGGARAVAFLGEQFDRLAQHGIHIYWAGGNADRYQQWQRLVHQWPNVHLFPSGRVERLVHLRGDTPVASLLGISRRKGEPLPAAQFRPDPDGLPSIGVVYGLPVPRAVLQSGFRYLALGGSHQRKDLSMAAHTSASQTLSVLQRHDGAGAEQQDDERGLSDWGSADQPQVPAHFPGTPQGRSAQQLGPHGCTLVEIAPRRTDIHFRPTDALRWIAAQLTIDPATTRHALEDLFRHHIQQLRDSSPGIDLLVRWRISGRGQLADQLQHGPLAEELLGWLRREFGYGPPACWSVSLEVQPDQSAIALASEQDTVLGDLLRQLQQLQAHPDRPLELESLVDRRLLPPKLLRLLCTPGRKRRTQLIEEAAQLAVKLFGAEGTNP